METTPRLLDTLWAKKARLGQLCWLPLSTHLMDAAGVARELWKNWVPRGTQQAITRDMHFQEALSQEDKQAKAGDLLCFLCAIHDLGKATPVFQAKRGGFQANLLDMEIFDRQQQAGLALPSPEQQAAFLHARDTPHGLAGQQILLAMGYEASVAAVVGAHHGRPNTPDMLLQTKPGAIPQNYYYNENNRAQWQGIQEAVVNLAGTLSGLDTPKALPSLGIAAQQLLTALVILVDWIASNEQFFPYIGLADPVPLASRRLYVGLDRLNLPLSWLAEHSHQPQALYALRFAGQFEAPNAMQRAVADIASQISSPGILIIEAAMGFGKTEAALVAAEMFANKAGKSGIFFALPTQATSDGIYKRIQSWAAALTPGEAHSIRLAHGKAQFNADYRALFEGGDNINPDGGAEGLLVHPWFEGPKKALLADFVVGTVDQLLMMALKQKHVMLRHLGLAGKVVIIDECHAYDAYMSQYLERALNWLAAYGVPVIILSATLPGDKRLALLRAYQSGLLYQAPAAQLPDWATSQGYPLLTWTEGEQVCQEALHLDEHHKDIAIFDVKEEDLGEQLAHLLKDGGCAGIILNTVRQAQDMAASLQARFPGEVRLLHARFLSPHRARKEALLRQALGKPGVDTQRPHRLIVVGTQVLEQSLDIDFDVMFSEICPMDLLLQRLGRLHRHKRQRKPLLGQAACGIIIKEEQTFPKGSLAIYGEHHLLRCRALLGKTITLPRDIPSLVQTAYAAGPLPGIDQQHQAAARLEMEEDIHRQRLRANAWRIIDYQPGARRQRMDSLLDVTNRDQDEAAVRDSESSIEVLLVQEDPAGRLRLLGDETGAEGLSPHQSPDQDVARLLAQQSLRLSGPLANHYNIEKTIQALEESTRSKVPSWLQSPWLRDSLFLFLDQSGAAQLLGYHLHYDNFYGLRYEKEDKPLENS